jgi:hypothetical protein
LKVKFLPITLFIFLFSLMGCGHTPAVHGPAQARETPARKVRLIIMLDSSVTSLQAMSTDYQRALAELNTKLVAEHISFESYSFTNKPQIINAATDLVDENQIWGLVNSKVLGPSAASTERGTFFIPMFDKLSTICDQNTDTDFYVLILSDFEPDDAKFVKDAKGKEKKIFDKDGIIAASKNAASKTNLKIVGAAPIPSEHYVRDTARDSYLAPFGTSRYIDAGHDDLIEQVDKFIEQYRQALN